jgi:hypothetical protein
MDREEFRDHLLKQIGVIGAGETADAHDAEMAETIIDNCHSELEQQEVALWPIDDIPAYAIESFALYCKATCTAWGQEYDPRLQELALRRLRTITADKRAGRGTATYF